MKNGVIFSRNQVRDSQRVQQLVFEEYNSLRMRSWGILGWNCEFGVSPTELVETINPGNISFLKWCPCWTCWMFTIIKCCCIPTRNKCTARELFKKLTQTQSLSIPRQVCKPVLSSVHTLILLNWCVYIVPTASYLLVSCSHLQTPPQKKCWLASSAWAATKPRCLPIKGERGHGAIAEKIHQRQRAALQSLMKPKGVNSCLLVGRILQIMINWPTNTQQKASFLPWETDYQLPMKGVLQHPATRELLAAQHRPCSPHVDAKTLQWVLADWPWNRLLE